MAYFPMGYNPMQPNVYPTQQGVGGNAQGALIWVQGEAGAKSYLVAPNQTVQLWDSESQTIYLKSADASGMPSIKVLDYTVRDAAQKPVSTPVSDYATKEDISIINNEINALKAKLERMEVHDESIV